MNTREPELSKWYWIQERLGLEFRKLLANGSSSQELTSQLKQMLPKSNLLRGARRLREELVVLPARLRIAETPLDKAEIQDKIKAHKVQVQILENAHAKWLQAQEAIISERRKVEEKAQAIQQKCQDVVALVEKLTAIRQSALHLISAMASLKDVEKHFDKAEAAYEESKARVAGLIRGEEMLGRQPGLELAKALRDDAQKALYEVERVRKLHRDSVKTYRERLWDNLRMARREIKALQRKGIGRGCGIDPLPKEVAVLFNKRNKRKNRFELLNMR